jgi:uncharacterized OB-fold protein
VKTPATLRISRCASCHSRFLPRRGLCPRCGSDRIEPYEIPARGAVLAATELNVPLPGWPSPHRLALLEAADGVRFLALARQKIPEVGAIVGIAREEDHYVVLPAEPTS